MQNPSEDILSQAEAWAKHAGFFGLRPLQREVLHHLSRGESVFAGLPTGYGKSLCYWLPAAVWGWRVWVLSPLVSLIEDQAAAAAALGLHAIAWHGQLSPADRRAREQEMADGRWQVCLLAPERFLAWSKSGYLHALERWGLDADLLVLDEMHCLEEWREFRAGYQSLLEHVQRTTGRGALLLGLSASLSEEESRIWMGELCGTQEGAFAHVSAGIGRENLHVQVLALEEEEERWVYLLSALRGIREPESVLIYCTSRQESDEVTRWLKSAGFPAAAYHAGLPAEERAARSKAFRAGQLRIVCATSAFGMGIDYPHVARVIHFSMPHDLESYWQEVGRAGRSGSLAQGIAFWRRSEISRARFLRGSARQRFLALWRAWSCGDCRKRVVARRMGWQAEDCRTCDRCLGSVSLVPAWREPWWVQRENKLSEWVEDQWSSG